MLLQGVTVDNYTEATNIQTQSYMFTFTLLEGFSRKKGFKSLLPKAGNNKTVFESIAFIAANSDYSSRMTPGWQWVNRKCNRTVVLVISVRH